MQQAESQKMCPQVSMAQAQARPDAAAVGNAICLMTDDDTPLH